MNTLSNYHAHKNSVLVVIPLHTTSLDTSELFALRYSMSILSGRPTCLITPQKIDTAAAHALFPESSILQFDNQYFNSTDDYSRLLIQADFYKSFCSFEFILILQPDAIIFRDELDYWVQQPYDYIGAPWYEGYEFNINLDKFSGNNSRAVRMHVGNGGLSLRRVSKCIDLIREFPEANYYFAKSGSNEDFFFSLLGGVSSTFLLPNEVVASRFSMEHRPDFYYQVNGNVLPMGAHGWAKLNKEFWLKYYPQLRH